MVLAVSLNDGKRFDNMITNPVLDENHEVSTKMHAVIILQA